MSSFEVLVRPVSEVYDHPNADRLSIVKVLGYEAISAKNEDGAHRFHVGESVVYVPEGAVLPDSIMKHYGFWNEEKNIGLLAGGSHNRVKAIRLRGILSQGLVFKTLFDEVGEDWCAVVRPRADGETESMDATVGEDVAEFLGITKYEPRIPTSLDGQVISCHQHSYGFDIENAQNFPGFLDNDIVEATEKLHGTCFRVSYRHEFTQDGLFGNDIGVSSKGMGAKGLIFKDATENDDNLYIKIAKKFDLINKVRTLGESLKANVDLLGEIFGRGVQDLHYGTSEPQFRAFDVLVNGVFASPETRSRLIKELEVEQVPVLYTGTWNEVALIAVRDGKTALGESNVREGIVITAMGDQTRREYMNYRLRPCVKMVSPDYLLRKGETTEFN